MAFRRGGRDLELDPARSRAAYPNAKPRLAVFVHGLCETDDAWKLGPPRATSPTATGWRSSSATRPCTSATTPAATSPRTGASLRGALEQLVAAWPVPVDEIALIGHSMGGLVARSACHYGAGSACVAKVRHVFTLGTPHRGAPLEQVTNAASAALARLPETRPLAQALNIRSSGIKDLRYGYLVDECWMDQDCDAFLRDTSREIPFLPDGAPLLHLRHADARARRPVGRIIGDLLVLQPSAWAHPGRGKRLHFPIEHYYHLGGANHFDLLNHPAIYAQIRRCLQSQRALPAPAAG